VINIRIHAPNISHTTDGVTSPMPDLTTFNALAKIIELLVDEQYKSSFHTYVVTPGTIVKDTDGSSFMLIQVNYNSYNTEYTNI
jgi:hypothetical protein